MRTFAESLPGSQSRADFQANLARILRSEADLPQGRFPLKRNALSKSRQLFQHVLISAQYSGNGLSALQVTKSHKC